MISKLWGYIAAAGVAILSVVGIFLKGRNDGKKLEKANQAKSDIKARDVANEKTKTANKIENEISVLPDDVVQQRLRDKYSRD